jgi:glutathione peroxidase
MKREVTAVLAAFGMAAAGLWSVAAASQGKKGGTVYDYDLTAIDGSPMPMSKFKGKVILLVNTASFCGFTPQYAGLQRLQTTYGPRGFTVIGVPSGNFLGQEYKTNKEISTFCQTKFGIKFPLAEKSDVIGPNAIPIYKWAAAELGMTNIPKWNFHKYLIGRDGRLIAAFGTKTNPMDVKVTTAISAALAKPEA